MADPNFFDQFDPPAAQGYQIKGPDPMRGINVAKGVADLRSAPLDREGKTVGISKTRQEMANSAAVQPFNRRKAAAEAALAEETLRKARAVPKPMSPEERRSLAYDAVNKINTIRDIRRRLNSGILPDVGFGAKMLSGIGGTDAANVAADVQNLQSGAALSEVLKMSQATGRNPFTPMSNSDVDLISRNIANLDQGQTRDNFLRNLDVYEKHFADQYLRAGGRRETLYPSAKPSAKGGGKVVDFHDLPE
jgi:hypothetical protein